MGGPREGREVAKVILLIQVMQKDKDAILKGQGLKGMNMDV